MSFIRMNNITKTFPNVVATDDCTLEINKGEIFSLIGENGAGKSTMMKILYGLYEQDKGTIEVDGKLIQNMTPHKAIEQGIGMVHQEFMLVSDFTVLENTILGHEPKKTLARIDFREATARIQKYIDDYKLDVPINRLVKNISVGQAQRVEIIKALYRGANTLILDEPTAVLTPSETQALFQILRTMRDDGKTVIFISHKLGEVLEISDRIGVMRRGKYISTLKNEGVTASQLANLMVGREVLLRNKRSEVDPGRTVLEVENLKVLGQRRLSTIKGISFSIKSGEVLGVAGVDGNGQTELVQAIAGLRPIYAGDIILDGVRLNGKKPASIRRAGLTHIPEDRNQSGLNMQFSISENLVATNLKLAARRGVIRKKMLSKTGDHLVEKYDVRPADASMLAGNLSGGNAQKLVVAREVEAKGKLLIASQPTRGVDIGAIEFIRNVINAAKTEGCAVLLVSADLDEIVALSDRIIVLHEGKISGELNGDNVDMDLLGLLMMGGSEN